MQEDIKILKELTKEYNSQHYMDMPLINGKQIQALENLLKGYRELEERYLNNRQRTIKLESKIKEKTEELESKIKATFCKYMTEEDYYNNKFLSSDVAEDYEVLEVRKLISNRNLLQELMEDK